MNRLRILCILILLGFLTQPASAQWTSIGPDGAPVYHTIEIANQIYAGTEVGIYKSSDSGQTWTFVSSPIAGLRVVKLYYDGTYLYAGVGGGGVYRSPDMGLAWVSANNAQLGNPYGVAYIGGHNGKLLVSTNTGRFASSDQGNTWTALANPPNVVVDPGRMYSDGANLFTHQGNGNLLYKSTDDGASWNEAVTGMGANPGIQALFKIGNDLYAVGWYLFRSTDGGDTWTKVNQTQNNFFTRSCLLGNTIYASMGGNTNVHIFKITVGDTAWTNITSNLPDGGTNYLFAYGNEVFIDKDGFLYKTSDGGASWTKTGNTGMSGLTIYALLAEGQTLYAGAEQTVYISDNYGASWTQSGISVPYTPVTALHRFNSKLIAGTEGEGIFISSDNGLTFPTQKLPTRYVTDLVDDGTTLYVSADEFIWNSTDAIAWNTTFTSGLPGSIIILALHTMDNSIYAGVGVTMPPFDNAGVWASPVASAAWLQKSAGIHPEAATCFAHIGNTLYAGTSAGVYKSTDGGGNWTQESNGIENREIRNLLVITGNLVAATDSGIYELANGSSTWTDISGNLPARNANTLAHAGGYLYAGMNSNSVWRKQIGPVGVNETKTSIEAALSPNPAGGTLNLFVSGSMSWDLEVIDLTGRVILSEESIRVSSHSVDISQIPDGLYAVRIRCNEKELTKKFLKK